MVLPDNGDRAIRVVDGDGQRGVGGRTAGRAGRGRGNRCPRGAPVEGATVEFVLTSAGAGAGITPSTAQTSAEGRAQAQVLLGDKVGLQTGEARVAVEGPTSPKTTFSALAESDDNRPPRADFGWSCDDLTCQFTDASTDSDGSVTGWAWRFGDGGTSAEREPTHSYAAGGTFTVTLTVTDDEGSSDESSDDVTANTPVGSPGQRGAPGRLRDRLPRTRAARSPTRARTRMAASRAGCGTSATGTTSSQRNPSHSYDSPGQYDVRLRVTDDDGAADDSRPAPRRLTRRRLPATSTATGARNAPPGAEFEVDCQDRGARSWTGAATGTAAS